MVDCVVLNTKTALEGQTIAKIPTTSAFASPPSSPSAGDVWFPSDSFYMYRYSGSAWVPWGPIFPLTPPVSGDFSWVNQGGASIDTTYGGIFLTAPAGSGDNLRMRVKSAPSTPYVITAAFMPLRPAVDTASCGLLFRDSASGKVMVFAYTFDTVVSTIGAMAVVKFTNATTFSAAYSSVLQWMPGWALFMRIADNGDDRICSVSHDGQHWIDVHAVGRTDFLTADQIGFYANSNNANWPCAMTLVSWKQT